MASILAWLHLSDLHISADALDDLRVVLRALWRDLPAQIDKAGRELDFVAFTGDIAYSGKEEEYRLAEKHFFQPLLDVTGLPPTKLFVVPGNHDLDWDLIEVINPAIAASLTDRDKVTSFLESDAKRRILFAPMAGYAQFIQRFFGDLGDHRISLAAFYSYAQMIVSGTPSVALVGLNSAWLSGFARDEGGRVTDRGNLLVGHKQIDDAFGQVKNAEARIALLHHPPSWLRDFDAQNIRTWLQLEFDFVLLSGLHDPDITVEEARGGETITITAGTAPAGRGWLNCYNLVRLDFEMGQGKVWFYSYDQSSLRWQSVFADDSPDGSIEFELPRRLGPPIPSPSDPIWLDMGREKETELLEAFIRQETTDTLWIWGNSGCGLTEFLQIVRVQFQRQAADVIYFDAEDAEFGIAVDQHYFLDKLERWAGTAPDASSDRTSESIKKRFKRLLAGVRDRPVRADRRLVLIFANYHLLIPTIREWVKETLWGQVREPLKSHRASAIFACEGAAPACPASDQENKIYLPVFTVRDVERFLRKLPSIDPDKVSSLAQRIHSESADGFSAVPRRVFQSLVRELVLLSRL